MNFPSEGPQKEYDYPQILIEALQVDPIYVGRSRFDYLIEIESEKVVRALNPNFSMLGQIQTRGVIVTAKSDSFDFVSRCFFPAVGVNEDPVTGSAHCSLGPYWRDKLNKTHLRAYQASKRGGILQIDVKNNRVLLGGQAVTVLKSEFIG